MVLVTAGEGHAAATQAIVNQLCTGMTEAGGYSKVLSHCLR